ncbi:MAG: DUF4202 domain-containing protein [Vicinamibacterales bacterium]
MTDSPLVLAARAWVIGNYPYNREHLLRALERLDDLEPASSEAVRLATLTHDMERAFPGPDSPHMSALDDPEYNQLHCQRSARIVTAWLREQHAPDALASDVERLILAHETGGWPEADLVQAADSLSFLDTNVDLFLGFVRSGRFPVSAVRSKFEQTYDRIKVPRAKAIARPLVDGAIEKLAALERSLAPSSVPSNGDA